MEAGGYSHTLTIQVCAAGQGMVFRPSSLEQGQYISQENNVGNRVYNYIKLINSLIQVAINSLERHTYTVYGHVLDFEYA